MSQFIRAIEIDQTPNKLMFEYGSELAQQANLEAQRQMTLLKMKQEQDAALGSAFGDLYKMGLDRVKDLTAEQRNIALEQLKTGLANSLKESKGNPSAFKVSALTGPLKDIVTYEASRKDIASAGAERAKQLANAGIKGDAVEAFTAKYMLDPSKASAFNIEDFYAEMDKDIATRPQLYMDKEKLRQTVVGRLDEKGVDFEREIQLDPTGVNKKTASVKIPMKPWETTGKIKMPNGIEVEAPQLKMENIDGMNVIAQESFDKFIGGNPLLKTAVITAAKETVHDINKKLGVNTDGMTTRDFSIAKSQNPKLVDPFNDGVVEVYAKDALTRMLKGSYDEQGFSLAGKRAYAAIKDNPPRTSITVNAGKDVPVIDQYKIYNDALKSGPKVMIKGKAVGVPLSMLESGQEELIEMANKVGKRDETTGMPAFDQSNLILTQGKGQIELRKWDKENSTVGDIVSVISKTKTNVKANQPLGTKSKQKAVTQANQPAKSGINWKQ
jgi:hypothetical protein